MTNPDLILPIGTQVVTRVAARPVAGGEPLPRGAVGVVVEAPADNAHTYLVRFSRGTQAALRRAEFAVRKHFQRGELARPPGVLDDLDLREHVIYRCVIGSRAYGLEDDESDTDRRGIYLPPAERHWSLYGVPEQLEDPAAQECYWELQKFLVLALKANPNILECLYTPFVEQATPLAQELLDRRGVFLSRMVYQTYNGYVLSQFKKLEPYSAR
jgi:hypothetical protein